MKSNGIIVFLDKSKNDINREARYSKRKDEFYNVFNLNMPYQGTISTVFSEEDFKRMLKRKQIEIK